MNNERVLAGEAPELAQLPTEIPDEVLEEGRQLGLSTDAITAAYFLSPDRTFFTIASERWPERRQKDVIELESIGQRVLRANAATRSIMRHNWVLTHGSAFAIDAAEFLGSNPQFADLLDDPDIAADMAYGLAGFTGRQAEMNRITAIAMAETGVMQVLNKEAKAHKSSRSTIIFSRVNQNYDTDEALIDEYCARRQLLLDMLTMPGLEKVRASEFGKKIPPSLVNRILATPSTEPLLRENIENFLCFVSNQANYDNLELIAERNPSVLNLLTPRSEEASGLDQIQKICDEVAGLEKGALPPSSFNLTSHLANSTRLRFVSICTQAPAFRRLMHSKRYSALISQGAIEWLFDPASGTEEAKTALLADPLFAKGLANSCGRGVTDKIAAAKAAPGSSLEQLATTFMGGRWRSVLRSYGDSAVNIEDAIHLFQHFYEEFRVDCFDLLRRWEEVGRDRTTTNKYITSTIKQMRELESRQPGICRVLRDQFQIRHFGRYGIEMLLRQYDERDKAGPHAISLYASPDGNTALQTHAQNWLPRMSLKLRGHNIIPRIFEAASPRECLTALSQAKRRYGPAKLGHGAVHGLEKVDASYWGSFRDETASAFDLLRINGSTYSLRQENDNGIGSVFEPGAPVLGNTCFGARESKRPSVARSWSVALGALVMTTAESAALREVEITGAANGLHVTPHFYNDATPVPLTSFNGQQLRQDEDPSAPFTFDDPNFAGDMVTYYLHKVRKTMP